ncbi:tripartite-type tricarboxylate transporter receptor subunit TctC [Rhodobium orientis]|nr:tripartite tricarboxylate transporter substrate binding protein [Rhodobium orientis]MBB4302120.1 tripartite-type tricarboxylate transporter receptor subunit TctC [Rhodobium orientis]
MIGSSFIRRCLGATLTAALAFSAASGAVAKDWPTGPVQIIVSYSAGGGTDRQARLLAGPLEEVLGVPVTVQNLPGGGGQVAATAVLREPADEAVILATNEPDLSMGPLLKNAPYSRDDLTVVAVDVTDPRLLLVAKDSPYKTFDDFVKAAKENPGELTISASQGGAQELFAKWLVGELGLDVRIVGYPGGSKAANAMLGGHVTAALGDDFSRLNIRDQSHALLIAADGPSPRWPEAAVMAEVMPKYGVEVPTPDFLARFGIYAVQSAMKKDNPEHYKVLQDAILKAMNSETFLAAVKAKKLDDLSKRAAGEDFKASFDATAKAVAKAAK